MADNTAPQRAAGTAVGKPEHVPDALVYDFDLFRDAALIADPHARILDLVENVPPIFWTPAQGGQWVVTSYDAAFEASRNWGAFSSEFISYERLQAMQAALPPGSPHIPIAVPINLDPPEHGKYRMPLNLVFSPKAIDRMKDDIRALARQLVARTAGNGHCEFMSEIAEPMPVQIFLKLMGLPLDRQSEYRALVREHLSQGIGSIEESLRKLQRITATMRATFIERRDNPQDDLISRIWKTEIDGKPTTLDDLENYGVLLFIAGLDTVMNSMGFGVRHLAQDLALQDRLRNDPGLIPDAVEELLRRYSIVAVIRKIAKDHVFHGVAMKKDERALLMLPGANLDARHFKDPAQFDVDRADKVHIAFNAGPHRCLGSHLARLELQILLDELLAGLPRFRLDAAKPPVFHGGNVIGVDELHLVWPFRT
jgi:cytochrome P450